VNLLFTAIPTFDPHIFWRSITIHYFRIYY